MSQMRFCYNDLFKDSTVVNYNSEEILLPVENIGNEILAKKYKTKTGFIITTGYNDVFQFAEGRTGSSTVVSFALSATTFTGAELAAVVQTGMRANGMFTGQTVSYSTSTERFTTTKSSTATSMSLRFADIDMSVCEIMGYIKKDHASASTFISSPTKGNQQWIEVRKADFSGSVFIVQNHNLSSGTVMKVRGQSTSTFFYGLNQYGRGNGSFEAYTNKIDDPCDLTQASWTKVNGCVATLSGIYINGNQFTKLRGTTGTANPQIYDIITLADTVTKKMGSIIFRNISVTETTIFSLYQVGGTPSHKGYVNINWTTKIISLITGDSLDYEWLDDNTVQIYVTSLAGEIGFTTWDYLVYPPGTGDTNQEFLVTECQLVDETTTMFPFVDGSHTKDEIDIEFTMPDAFTEVVRFKPRFAYDTGGYKYIARWCIDSTHSLNLYYYYPEDLWLLLWVDGGASCHLSTSAFDDGTTYIDINQEIVIAFSFDPAAGTNGSRLICIPTESGAISENTTWSGPPDAKISTFPTKSIAHSSGGYQGNSDIESIRTYDGPLVGAVTSFADLEALLADMTILLDLNYKNTDYMRHIATSTTFGQFEQEITVDSDPCVTILDETIHGNVLQISWTDIKNEYSEIGRIFLSPVFYPANHPDNIISWFKKKIFRRSKQIIAMSGATRFDKRDSIYQYTIVPDPMSEYYNPTTKAAIEDMLDAVGNDTCFYIILDSDLSNTVYGFIIGDTEYNRLRNTPIIKSKNILFQEQK